MVLLLFVVIFAAAFFFLVSKATKDTYTFDWLIKNSDYMIMTDNSEPYKIPEISGYTVCYSLPISEYYEKNGEYFLELDVNCFHQRVLPEAITIVSDKKHIKVDEHHLYILFLNEIEGREGFYTITNGKTGIIEIENKKLKPYDKSLKKELNENFEDSDVFLEWFYDNCEKDVKRIEKEQKEEAKTKSPVTPETTQIPY